MKYKLNIPEPCHEDWQQMTPTQKGKFCDNCQKEVIDFTKLSSTEIARKTKSAKHLCGRFTSDQLDQEYVSTSQNSLSKLGIALGLGSIVAVAQPGFAQEEKVNKIEHHELQGEVALDTQVKYSITIKGTVTDEENMPLPGVNVIQQNTNHSTQTDFDGNFSIEISEEDFENDLVLEFYYVGFATQRIRIESDEVNQTIKLQLNPDIALEGEVVIVRTSIFQRFLNLFRSKGNKHY